jgi:hypothetical protein
MRDCGRTTAVMAVLVTAIRAEPRAATLQSDLQGRRMDGCDKHGHDGQPIAA